MGVFSSTMKFVANHVLALLITFFVISAGVVFFSMTDMGKAGISLIMEYPGYFLFIILLAAAPVIVWLWMLRPKTAEELRLSASETLRRAQENDWGLEYKISKRHYLAVATHPIHGRLFSGFVFEDLEGRLLPKRSVLFSDRPATGGQILCDYGELLNKDEIAKIFKKELTFEEQAQISKAFDAKLESFGKQAAFEEEQRSAWGKKNEQPVTGG